MASGDPFVVSRDRKLTRPDYAVQGLLARKLMERGHRVTLLSRVADLDEDRAMDLEHESGGAFTYDPGARPGSVDCDLLWMDRLHKARPEISRCADLAGSFSGLKIYHQFIYYSGWDSIVTSDWSVLTREQRRRNLHNRLPMSFVACPRVSPEGFHSWEPFLHGEIHGRNFGAEMDHDAVYVGRLPKFDTRTRHVEQTLLRMVRGGLRVAVGGTGEARDICKLIGATYLGPVSQSHLMRALSRGKVVLQFPADPYRHINAVPNRAVEAHLAQRVQVFHVPMEMDYRFRTLKPYHFATGQGAFDLVQSLASDASRYSEALEVQQAAFAPICDSEKVMDRLEKILRRLTE